MSITIAVKELVSRELRNRIAGAKGIRKISTDLRFSEADDGNGIVGRLVDSLKRFTGWLFKTILKVVPISVTAIFNWLFTGITRLSQFDWNATDAELRRIVQGQNVAVASAWGSFVGQGIGWLSAIGVGYGVGFLCPVIGSGALARVLASQVSQEAVDEIVFGLRAAIRQTLVSWTASAAVNAYIGLRKWIKRSGVGGLTRIFGDRAAGLVEIWGTDSAPNISFSNLLEERIERIPQETTRAFYESLFDEAFDSFMEGGYIIAAEIDAAYAQAKIQQQKNAEGVPRGLEVFPDKENPRESIYFQGTQKDVKEQVLQTLNTHRLVHNRDIGMVVGQPAEDWYRARPQRRKLVIVFKGAPSPPWVSGGRVAKEASYSIPDAKVGISWTELQTACDPYLWGKFRATANLNNGRQMAVYGASPQDAERTLRKLLRLSTAELVTLSISEEKDRNPKLRKDPVMMYPAFATMLIRRPSVDASGMTDLEGNTWDESRLRYEIWRPEQPPDFQLL